MDGTYFKNEATKGSRRKTGRDPPCAVFLHRTHFSQDHGRRTFRLWSRISEIVCERSWKCKLLPIAEDATLRP